MPFFTDRGEPLSAFGPGVLLRQLSPSRFRVEESFSYTAEDGTEYPVDHEALAYTDLTSVPRSAWWFAGPYGRHTLAALLHDRYVQAENPLGLERHEADTLFLEALGALKVGTLRRYALWSATVAATRFYTGALAAKVALALWTFMSVVGTFIVVAFVASPLCPVVTPPLWLVGVALIAPFAAAFLWGRDWKAGLVAAFGVLLVAPATVGAWIAGRIFEIGAADPDGAIVS